MSKIVFITPYEYSYLGTRCLASWLRANGFDTHNVLFEDYKVINVKEPREDGMEGYQGCVGGLLNETHCSYKNISNKHKESLIKILKEHMPDVIGYTARSILNDLASEIVSIVKEAAPNALLVAGGYGPTLDPEIYLDAGFDVVSRGDGEEALLGIMQSMENNTLDYALTLPGTYWHEKRGGAQNKLSDQVKEISKYPAPLYGDEYFSYIQDGELHQNIDPILKDSKYFTFFGRGCIGNCTYCSGGQWSQLYRNEGAKAYKRRNRNVDDVLEELSKLPPNVKWISFADEFWSMNTKDTKKFFKLYKEKINLPFGLYLPYEQIVKDDELFNTVRDAGLGSGGIGFQTGSYSFAKKYYHRNNDYDTMLAYAQKLYRNKMTVYSQFIGGNCYETEEDHLKTIKLIQKLPFSIEEPNISFIQSARLKPFPHSPITELFPRVLTDKMNVQNWYYRSILEELSRFLPLDKIRKLMKVKKFRKNPRLLQKFLFVTRYNMQYDHFKNLVEMTTNENWVFYGHGYSYQHNKDFFAKLNPKYIIVDEKYLTTDLIDNTPVISTEKFFAEHNPEEFNYLNFIYNSPAAQRRLLLDYNVPFDKIHSCAKNFYNANFSTDERHLYRSEEYW